MMAQMLKMMIDDCGCGDDDDDRAGPIPSELQHLMSIQTIQLDVNRLTGKIPSEIANLGNTMTQFIIRSNKIVVSGDERTYWQRQIPRCTWGF